jgi:SET domain-containing protein
MSCDLGVLRCRGEFSLLAARPLPADERLFTIHGDLTPTPSRYSVQIDENLHVDLREEPDLDELLDSYFWRFMNHSCDPNAAIRGREVVAIRRIEPWEQITFDYNTTEFEMAEPFDCRCGTDRGVGQVAGFRLLDRHARERLRPLLADHLRRHVDTVLVEAGR